MRQGLVLLDQTVLKLPQDHLFSILDLERPTWTSSGLAYHLHESYATGSLYCLKSVASLCPVCDSLSVSM